MNYFCSQVTKILQLSSTCTRSESQTQIKVRNDPDFSSNKNCCSHISTVSIVGQFCVQWGSMFIPARKNKGKIWTDVKVLFLTSSFLRYFSFFPFPLPLISSLQTLIALLISKLCSLNNVLTPLFLNIIGDVSKVPNENV